MGRWTEEGAERWVMAEMGDKRYREIVRNGGKIERIDG